MKQFKDVDCSRGAPMGRYEIGLAENCAPRSVSLFRVRLNGDYDDGGAYWGSDKGGPRLFCARSDDCGETQYRAFVRAFTRIEAARALHLTEAQLKRGNYAAR